VVDMEGVTNDIQMWYLLNLSMISHDLTTTTGVIFLLILNFVGFCPVMAAGTRCQGLKEILAYEKKIKI